LVKWQGLGYAQATWEWEEDVSDDTQIAKFHRFQHAPSTQTINPAMLQDVRPDPNTWKRYGESPKYKGERTLRSYQLEGLNWLVFSWYQVMGRLCVLGARCGWSWMAVVVAASLRDASGRNGAWENHSNGCNAGAFAFP
jgi:chromodomain-helicase-DNA-binding protein 7